MEIKTNGEYNACQYGLTTNLSPDGKVLSKSEMIVLRGETPKEIAKNFRELKELIEGKEKKSEKKVKNNPGKEKKQSKKEGEKDENVCPQCGSVLLEKSGISSKNGRPYHFWSCSSWPICNYTKPFLSEAKKKAPCADEDLVESIPF